MTSIRIKYVAIKTTNYSDTMYEGVNYYIRPNLNSSGFYLLLLLYGVFKQLIYVYLYIIHQ